MPFGDYESFDDCVAANQDKDNPEGYCAALHKKITGKWPAESRFAESFEWTTDVQKLGPLLRGTAIHPVKTYHPDEWPHLRVFLEEELEKSVDSLVGKPLFLDHWYQLPQSKVLAAKYNDGALEYVADPGVEADRIFDLIRKGDIEHTSIQFEWKILEQVNGIAPRGINYQHLSLLKDVPPGDPQTTVEIFESIAKQLKEAKGHQPNPQKGSESGVKKMSLEEQRGQYQNLIDTWSDWAGSYTKCVEVLSGKEDIENPEALCAWLHHEAEGKWPAEESAVKAVRRVLAMQAPETPPVLKKQEEPPQCPEGQKWDPEKGECVPVEEAGEQQGGGQPKTDVERAKAHFEISDEDWDKLSDEAKQAYIDKLPPVGTKREQAGEEPKRDEHGCVIGKERWDEEQQKCVPIEAQEQQGDDYQAFIKECLASGKTMEQCAAEWKEQHPEQAEEPKETIEALRAQIEVLTGQKKELQEELEKIKKTSEAIIPSTVTLPPDMIPKKAIETVLPPEWIARAWGMGPQRFVQDIKKVLKSSK